ncbi:MAG: hypothetical protein IJQ71_01065 [Clostridia bacterium]|nr:hypothetical protein [Clostridia bacterium]
MNERIRQLHRAKLLPAITSIAFGIALIIARKGAMDVAIKIGAVMLGLCGLGCILMYITGKVRELPQMCIGCLLLLAGVLCWIYSGVLVDIFPIITGIGLILNGLSNLAATREYSGNGGAGLIVLFSILMIAGGVLIIIYANRMVGPLMIYMGIGYILNGLMDLTLMYRVKDVLMNKSGAIPAEPVDNDEDDDTSIK